MRVPFALLGIVWVLAIAAFWHGVNQRFTSKGDTAQTSGAQAPLQRMRITSTAFESNGTIASRYTCDGGEVSPPLTIDGVPGGAVSLALVMEDPDVPKALRADGHFVHWVVFDIPSSITEIPEGTAPGVEGVNTAGESGYAGPCPPPQYEPREHRYVFTVYALDTMLGLAPGANKHELTAAMEGHIIDMTQYTARYERPGGGS